MSGDEEDLRHMRRALALARRGRGRVRPNPVVGAVVVRAGRVVGEGWHRAAGEPHAEVVALGHAGRHARGATLYVSLEPCAHRGRTPPCVDAILAAGVTRCVVAVRDPHPVVRGRGLRRLRAAGLELVVGVAAAEARETLGGYWLSHTRGTPRVTLKLALSLDGHTAPPGGFATRGPGRWLTSPAARQHAHGLRAASDAIVIGAETARRDDPRLDVRGVRGARMPLRVVCATDLRLPRTLRLLRPPLAAGTVVACAGDASRAAERGLVAGGVTVWRLPRGRDGVAPGALVRRLVAAGCHEILLEGGATLAGSWLRAGVVDRLARYTAPVVLGGGPPAWAGRVPARRGRILEQRRLGPDAFELVDLEG